MAVLPFLDIVFLLLGNGDTTDTSESGKYNLLYLLVLFLYIFDTIISFSIVLYLLNGAC